MEEGGELNCALLCPGPSLADCHNVFARYPLRVAVNRAILLYPCHAWVALDWISVVQIDAAVTPLYTSDVAAETLTPARWPRVREFDIRARRYCPNNNGLTAISALHVCRELGATSIDVYGADWTNAPDFDGVELVGTVRDEKRWAREARLWAQAVAELEIPVRRMKREAAVH